MSERTAVGIFGVITSIIAVVGLAGTLIHDGYLALLGSAASAKKAAGAPINDFVRSRRTLAAVTTALAVLGLLFTFGSGWFTDIVGALLAGGSGIVAGYGLRTARERLNNRNG